MEVGGVRAGGGRRGKRVPPCALQCELCRERGLTKYTQILLQPIPHATAFWIQIRNLLLTVWRLDVRRHLGMEEARKAVQSQFAR